MLEHVKGECCRRQVSKCMATKREKLTDGLAAKLRFDSFERLLHAEPEVDLLTSSTTCDITIELGNVLNLFDPAVDLSLQLVEK